MRRFYQKQTIREGWNRDQLRTAIRKNLYNDQRKQKTTGVKPKTTLKRPAEASYLYKAVIERVVDGDTLLVRIDLGFQVWKEQRIRLAEIDTPPLKEKEGYEAFEYVRDRMTKAETIIIKTHKIDIYGRYVGYVFYSFKKESIDQTFQKGRYLNQELISKGLAEKF